MLSCFEFIYTVFVFYIRSHYHYCYIVCYNFLIFYFVVYCRSICVKFGIGNATAFRSVRRVTYALHCIASRFIQWPAEVADNVIDQFARVRGFLGVIGAIDGTYIKIRAPPTDSVSYINRKGFPFINLQVVCDSCGLFTHCYAGEVGSVHDARVFRNSPVIGFLERPEVYFQHYWRCCICNSPACNGTVSRQWTFDKSSKKF